RCPAAGRSSRVWTTRSTSITSSWPTTTLRARACSRASVTGFKTVLRAHFWLALVALIARLGGPAGAAPVAAVDATGARVELAVPAARIVSLAPHATELLFAAGAGERVVGVLAPADWPPEAARAARAAAAFRARLSALDSHDRDAAKLSVFYEIWHQPLYTIGGGHLITAAIRLCGGENVFGALATPAPAVGVEDVLVARPEAIIA